MRKSWFIALNENKCNKPAFKRKLPTETSHRVNPIPTTVNLLQSCSNIVTLVLISRLNCKHTPTLESIRVNLLTARANHTKRRDMSVTAPLRIEITTQCQRRHDSHRKMVHQLATVKEHLKDALLETWNQERILSFLDLLLSDLKHTVTALRLRLNTRHNLVLSKYTILNYFLVTHAF
jgi:hypothetical protein